MDSSFEIQLDLKKPIKTSFDETESMIRNLITRFKNGEYVSPENIKKANILYVKAKEAREKLIINNLYLVNKVASNHKGQLKNAYDYEDLIGAGNIAIVNSSNFFDFTRGNKFSTYAYYNIENAIQEEKIILNSEFGITKAASQNIGRIKAATNKYKYEHKSKTPSIETLSKMTGLSEKVVKKYLGIMQETDSFIRLDNKESDNQLDYFQKSIRNQSQKNYAQPDKILSTKESSQMLADMLNQLTPRESIIVALINGLVDGKRYSYSEIGKRLDISKQRVGAIAQTAYKKMREIMNNGY